MIQCKRLYDEASKEDGYRILVDRLWPRGVKKEALAYDEWCKTLTPSNELRKMFHSETIDFASFTQAYRQELVALHQDEGRRIARLADNQTVTLLYGAKDRQQNHALVLADWLREL
ncbi:DUF488 domain-containing protein [Leclercia adecarboxylata]|uniref:DUF488 domain-containing protein n=1 Tax=Leclercia adecarboxylata TaxID=83655 RepID=UPI002DBB9D49|nr:DUF488 domain-containing protein [Leclercia adecarboxylata]MEB6378857.1 DUF488 domain-containing protein [Leclercia adecarboxylata]